LTTGGLAQRWLLDPNHWPRRHYLQRCWHGYAGPLLPKLGGVTEPRSNWGIYVEESELGLAAWTGRLVEAERWLPDDCLTPFEQKYLDSGHELWRVRLD